MLKRLCLYAKVGRAKLKACLLKSAFRVFLLWRSYKRNGSIPTVYSQRATYNIYQSIHYRKVNLSSYYTSPHWTHQILVTCIFPTPCNHFHTHLVVCRATTSKCCVSPILNKHYSILRRTAIVLSCITWLCVLYLANYKIHFQICCELFNEALVQISTCVPISSVKARYTNTQLL